MNSVNKNDKITTVGTIIIGDEILSGRTVDQNLHYIAMKLESKGFKLREVRVISDETVHIVRTVNELRAANDYVITTGGIGPTHDDRTSEAIAKALDVPYVINEEALELLRKYYQENLNQNRVKMAKMPMGADIITNPVTIAPGFKIKNIFVLAGVPNIMQAMLDHVLPLMNAGPRPMVKTIATKVGEGEIADKLSAIQDAYPSVQIGSYPHFSREGHSLSIVVRGYDVLEVDKAFSECKQMLETIGGVDPSQNIIKIF